MLSSVIQRPNWLTFIDGSIFLRESLRLREQEEIDRLLDLLNDQVAANSLTTSNSDLTVIDESKIAAQQAAIVSLSKSVATGV